MNETLKGVAHIGAELAAAKADLQREMERHRKTWRQLEQVTGLLRRCMSDEALDNPHAIYVASEAALSQQAEPVEPAPAQDERSPEQLLPTADIEAIACNVHGECSRLPGSTFQNAAYNAILYALERIARPAQTEQQPVCWASSTALAKLQNGRNNSPCVLTDGPAEFNDTPLYAAPIAQTAPQPEQSGLVEAERDQLRAEVEGLRKDADRWRYVRLQGDDTHWLNLLRVDLDEFGGNINAAVDALIDGEAPAMAAKEA